MTINRQTRVLNLSTGETQLYTCGPRKAVIAAYAQARRDFNTWTYRKTYGPLVREGRVSVACGDFTAMKEATVLVNLSKCEPFRSTIRTVARWLPYDGRFFLRQGSLIGSKSLVALFVRDVLEEYKGYTVELYHKEEYNADEIDAIAYLRQVVA